MVKYSPELDSVFKSLADPTRRDILRRVSRCELSVSEVAAPYDLTIAAISKHLKVLEEAKLIHKRKHGKQHLVTLSPPALKDASRYLAHYQIFWEKRLDRLEVLLRTRKRTHGT